MLILLFIPPSPPPHSSKGQAGPQGPPGDVGDPGHMVCNNISVQFTWKVISQHILFCIRVWCAHTQLGWPAYINLYCDGLQKGWLWLDVYSPCFSGFTWAERSWGPFGESRWRCKCASENCTKWKQKAATASFILTLLFPLEQDCKSVVLNESFFSWLHLLYCEVQDFGW